MERNSLERRERQKVRRETAKKGGRVKRYGEKKRRKEGREKRNGEK